MRKNKLVLYKKKGKVACITLNRPKKLNALNSELSGNLRNAWVNFENDKELRVAIVTGNGKAFCSGMDLAETENGDIPDMNCMPNTGVEVTKPVIAAINGWSIGAGMALAACCDLRVMSEDAKFQFPEARIGYSGGGLDLYKHMPSGIVMEYLLTGEPMDAQRAYELGLVNRVTHKDEVLNEAEKLAGIIKENAPLTMRMLKMCNLEQSLSVQDRWAYIAMRYFTPVRGSHACCRKMV